MAYALSRSLCRAFALSSSPNFYYRTSALFCTEPYNISSFPEEATKSESESESVPISDSVPPSSASSSSSWASGKRPNVYDRPLENGVDIGIFRAILVGQVGQSPLQKQLKNGTTVTLLSVGTGGIRNNRRPFDNEDPREYANRCAVQWHRVCIYPYGLGSLVMKNGTPGSILYVEGNLETKIFSDPVTGLVRRLREIAIRQNGRIVFLGFGDGKQEGVTEGQLRGVGYY